ncbi:MAG TPA: FAD-dependent oxidoreductase [Candidatus Saccharimonadia bacterium]|nr:FAD-dependent oxidoreductase [Candidatus Saccharimonadia bacterium]
MKAFFDHSEKLNHNTTTFWFKSEGALEFIAGQFLSLNLKVDGKILSHDFTISSSPNSQLFSITLKMVQPLSKFKKFILNLKKGSSVNIGPVLGDFVIPIDEKRKLLYIAGGIGITPILSITKFLTEENLKRDIVIFHAISSEKDLIDSASLKKFKYVPVVSKPRANYLGLSGHLNLALVSKLEPKIDKNALFYVSGPETFVMDLIDQINQVYPDNQSVMDYFPGYINI